MRKDTKSKGFQNQRLKLRTAATIAIMAALLAIALLAWSLLNNFKIALLGLAGLALFLFGIVRGSINRWPRSLPFPVVAGIG